MKRQRKSKAQRGLVTRRIVYANRRRPHDRNQATRTTMALADVRVVRIEEK